MNTQEIHAALDLNPNQVLVNVIVLGEYVDLDPNAYEPNRRRLTMVSSEELEPWTSIGILRYAQMVEYKELESNYDEDDQS